MADLTKAATAAASAPSGDLERVQKFTREPFVLEGEDIAKALATGTARREGFDAALAEIEAGETRPSLQWRRTWSLLLGLERILDDEEPTLVDGGVGAFEAQLKKLRGYPVVINKWGSWCGPCRAEFPVFQRVAARKGKSVAFLGINGQDPTDEAEAFLAEFPLSFPSYVDKGGGEPVATAVDAAGPFPITIFVDRKGEIEIVLAKPYGTVAELEADIKLYLRA